MSFHVAVSSLAYWDAASRSWIVETERIELGVGASSRDIRLKSDDRSRRKMSCAWCSWANERIARFSDSSVEP